MLNFRTFMLQDWLDVAMAHFAVDSRRLQPSVPLPLDTFDGRAWVTLVPFRVAHIRCPILPRVTAALLRPVSDHRLVNVRTYVRDASGDTGIYFLREFTGHRLNAMLAPRIYGTPYRHARIDGPPSRPRVTTREGSLALALTPGLRNRVRCVPLAACPPVAPRPVDRGPLTHFLSSTAATPGSLDAFLLERYTAWCADRGRLMRFDIAHPPWRFHPATVRFEDTTLLRATFDWFREMQDATLTPVGHLCLPQHGIRIGPPRHATSPTHAATAVSAPAPVRSAGQAGRA